MHDHGQTCSQVSNSLGYLGELVSSFACPYYFKFVFFLVYAISLTYCAEVIKDVEKTKKTTE